jgi:hypothetical protein
MNQYFINWIIENDFKRAMSRGKEQCLLDLSAELKRRSLNDIHASMSWWACFREEPRQAIAVRATGRRSSEADRRKARRKITRDSRKKNRKRRKK